MNSGAFWELGDISDRDLQNELARLLASGSRTEARIIAHLAAVEDRRLHLEAGSSSLFDYCCSRLGLSENEAFHRITAARLARRFPAIFGLVERRAMHLTAVCLLHDYLPVKVQQVADNYNHLHEQPTLFYAVVVYSYLVGVVDPLAIGLAWAYVALRVVHSLIQATINFVPLRFLVFATSTLVLMAMTARNLLALIQR